MKRILLSAAVLLIGLSAQAQLKVGVNGGLPVGDFSDFYKANFGADVYYYFVGADDEFFNLGLASGYSFFAGDDLEILGFTVDVENAQFVPIAAAGRINLLEFLTAGADVGYGLGINDGNDGGFYYRATAGLDFGPVEISAFYLGYRFEESGETATLGSLGIGLLYDFEGK